MLYKILADLVVLTHFAWILFMLWGFILAVCGSISVYLLPAPKDRWITFFDRWIFRTIHLGGIVYVAFLTVLGKHCPLTIMENELREQYNTELTYHGSFVVHYIEKIVYPEANFLLFVIPTIIIAVFTVLIFIIRPPAKIKQLFRIR
jgi:uncharacterized protein DUF2784